MIKFNEREWALFRRLQRKHKVSTEFLRYNLANIQKIIWYQTWPRTVIKRFAVRKRNRVFLHYYRLRRVLFDQANRKIIKRMRQNVKQWSRNIVQYQKRTKEPEEYVEETICKEKIVAPAISDDVSKQLKEQLELLKSGRRQQPLIEANKDKPTETGAEKLPQEENEPKSPKGNAEEEKQAKTLSCSLEESAKTIGLDNDDWQPNLESTPEKQLNTIQSNVHPTKLLASDEKTEKSNEDESSSVYGQSFDKPLKSGLNFLDMLMSKVGSSVPGSSSLGKREPQLCKSSSSETITHQQHSEHSLDSSDGFLGFDDNDRIPGMLMTPIVPNSIRSNNSIFVSETLNEYMRQNDLETDYNIDKDKSFKRMQSLPADLEGLMTPKTQPPHLDMPAVPDNLLRFRTVAERKSYLQKFAKNSRLSIINNEACIYRELQKRIRYQKCKPNSQQLTAQSNSSSMSFTRNGWMAASFINTEFNKYYYQMLDVDGGQHKVKLRGVRGNNDEFRKKPYISVVKNPSKTCPRLCVDEDMWQDFKVIKTVSPKSRKLNKEPLPSVFKPCPLSHKTFQKPLDDDAAALLLAGGSMAVVRMPTVELEVFPECGKPLNEIAKRYLQYILPHHDISREWAEFSVSTLKLPGSLRDAVKAATDSIPRKSFTFVIPYLNDRNHVLVRRVVDRSEKLDESFEQCLDTELVPKSDFTFRQNLDTTSTDDVLLTCADVVSDMINTVAISCSENSFIKDDPDVINEEPSDSKSSSTISSIKTEKLNRPSSAASNNSETKKRTKQNRVLTELKRLNATIIDAAVKPEKEKKPCNFEYCAMGCVCDSLAEESHVREHCGKTKCMWECTCKTSNQSRILRLETDGRTITTEDAFMLRRKATARLARMEKEFTSTVVLTGNETLLINETNNDKKRRCTKAPKRYEYYDDDTDDELRKNSPKKTALTTIDNEKNLAVEVKEIREPVYIQDTVLEQLKHCTVNLVRLKDMDNVAPWCLIHNLYKCFCKGKALEGKPMVIEKGENNTTIEHGEGGDSTMLLTSTDYKASSKARYTFEKAEKSKKSNDMDDSEESGDNNSSYEHPVPPPAKQRKGEHLKSRNDDQPHKHMKEKREPYREKEKAHKSSSLKEAKQQPPTSSKHSRLAAKDNENEEQTEKPKRSLEEVRERFFASRPDSCRRQIPIPRRMFLYCNRKRRLNVLNYIKENETEQTRLLLNEHVMRSVYYHKADNEKLRKQQEEVNRAKAKDSEKPRKQQSESHKNNEKREAAVADSKANEISSKTEVNESPQIPDIVDLIDDDEDDGLSKEDTQINDNMEVEDNANGSTKQDPLAQQDSVIRMREFATLSSLNMGENNESTTNLNSPADKPDLMFPKISSCFSLNAKANITKPLAGSTADAQKLKQLADLTSVTSVHSTTHDAAAASSSQNQPPMEAVTQTPATAMTDHSQLSMVVDNESVHDVCNSVIRTMNSYVSKKMQEIDFALRRESHIIPAPSTDILCIMKWSNFLDAFNQGFAFIWQVKSKEGTYLVATIRNMMPMICDAMGVVNITALKPDRVPLMAKMLLHNVNNEHTTKLAIVMQGKFTYWIVKGFLRADPVMACYKPTPETHPSLTKKINILCTSLVKQRQKEEKKKQQMLSKKSNSIESPVTRVENASGVGIPQMTLMEPVTMTVTSPITPLPSYSGPHQTVQPIYQTQKPAVAAAPPPPPSYNAQPTAVISPQIIAAFPANNNNNNNVGPITTFAEGSSRKRKSANDLTIANDINSQKIDSYAKMSTNIEFRKVTPHDVNEIHLPHEHKENHKWLVLDLHNDFSHIFVPDFRDLVSLDRIQKVINFAKQKNKIVKLQFFQNAPFDAFVTPKSGRKIYFGPLNMNMKPPTLILLQSVDGQMMLRELYQLKHNIPTVPEERTKAFWLLQMNGQTHFELEPTTTAYAENYIKTTIDNGRVEETTSGRQTDVMKNDDDDDCMIVDEADNSNLAGGSTQTQQGGGAGYKYFTISSVANDLQITPTTTIGGGMVSATTATPAIVANNSLLKLPHANTVIQSIVPIPPIVTSAGQQQFLNINSNLNSGVLAPLPPTVTHTSTATVGNVYLSPPAADNSRTMPNINPINKNSHTAPAAVTNQQILKTPATTTTTTTSIVKPVSSTVTVPVSSSSVTTFTQQPIAQKRRRVSIVCQNPFDRVSQNIAVSAVINKILPENIQDIQVNQPLSTLKSVSTIGSTTITKLSDNVQHQTNAGTTTVYTNNSSTFKSPNTNNPNTSKPLVFDVSFVDGDEEPGASIVIKPNSSPQKPVSATTTATTKIQISTVTPPSTVPLPAAKFSIKPARRDQYKVLKLPTTSLPLNSNVQTQNKSLYTKASTSLLTTSTTSTSTATRILNSNLNSPTATSSSSPASALPKKVLNTTNPIKITGISSIASHNSTIQLIPTSSVRIAPKSTATMATQSQTINYTSVPSVKSITITPTSTSTSVTYSKIQPAITPAINNTAAAAAAARQLASVTNATTTAVMAKQLPPSNNTTATITSTPPPASPVSNSNSGLTITSVQSFGVSPTKKKATATIKAAPIHQQSSSSSSSSASTVVSLSSPTIKISQQRNIPSATTNDANNRTETNDTSSPSSSSREQAPIVIDRTDNVVGGMATTLPPHIQYGYIVSPIYTDCKFVAKRVMEEFYVKVPTVGILKLIGLAAVNNYLNKHMQKCSNENTQAGDWKFVAASKAVQIQNHQKSMLVRKTKPGTNANKLLDMNKSSKVVNVTSMSEPILIDD
ncbi:uncharacterized protein LOC101891958 [Musca domestica]|uniref:Uncharacterized protein LOC101891958 n=1 Tax=Musca domestica TaxID=7370 RepID=A0ABM3VCL8_MUSDO|nr:uncharacterized protein LOC101891958 [Musca domestica]XP_011290458.2 uncharacterized protein LOC101891958 [Musca domestica]XP_058983533.1 uncharacterized protein LOC101891958 [Musca domestica]